MTTMTVSNSLEEFAVGADKLWLSYEGIMSGHIGDRWRVVAEKLRAIDEASRVLKVALTEALEGPWYDDETKLYVITLRAKLKAMSQ